MRYNRIQLTLLVLLSSFFLPKLTKAQEAIGMATGNYAGVSGIWFNPAIIADSKYKFDINLIGVNSYFNNNYLLVKNRTFARRLLFKEPYNSSYAAVKNDLIQEKLPVNGKVFGRVESNILFPFSFMVTTGKKSAIAFTMNNRSVNKVDSMPQDLARLFYTELRDPSLYNRDIMIDSMQQNFLNWQEIGFTYSRVLLNSDHHFLKMGVTLKWLGALAGGYIQTDNAVVNFKDSNTMSLQSPLIHYARTETADLGQFKRKNLFNGFADQTFGWDAGLIYEYRAKVKKFKYLNENLEEQQRRDLNKYMFRLGLSIVDVGRFTLNKKPLTNDHSANIVNWDFSDVKASSFSEFDTAYSKQVDYINGAPGTFTYRLPTALIGNFDLHLFGRFYVNLAAKAPLESFKKKADTHISPNRWIAITPRFEGKFLGVYIPVIRSNGETSIGTTIKLGPVYFGSNNLVEILTNESSYKADYHAGLRLSIPYGKPSKLSRSIENLVNGSRDTSYRSSTQRQLDSLNKEVDQLKYRLNDTSRNRGIQIIINNDGVSSAVERYNDDSVVIRSRQSETELSKQAKYNEQQAAISDSLLTDLARKNLEVKQLKEDLAASSSSSGKKSKKNSRKSQKVETSNEDLEQEVSRLRRQMAIQNAALIGGGTVAAVAVADNKKDKKEALQADTIRIRDTAFQSAPTKIDTVFIRDTMQLQHGPNDMHLKPAPIAPFEPIYFAPGKSAVNEADKKRLQEIAREVNIHKDWQIVLTAMTDATGSVATNRKVASARCAAVSKILLQTGVDDHKIVINSKLADSSNATGSMNPRRVELKVFTR